jgi:alkylated DNA repair dioxygenase AlkB
MKQITLTDGRVALVDDDDAEAAIRERYHAEDGLSAHPIEEEEAFDIDEDNEDNEEEFDEEDEFNIDE